MNIELLKKLTKLANNNPNDNEANSAARRVCKMLEEADWKLVNTEPVKQQGAKAPSSPEQQADWMKAYYNPTRAQEEFFRRARECTNPFSQGSWTGFGSSYGNEPPKSKRHLRCSKCNQIYSTTFFGRDINFVCPNCPV